MRVLVPLKITSCMDSPRSSLARDSPSTQRTASMMLDLPQPLGPTTPTSWPGSMKLVGSANDLNPDNLMELRRTEQPVRQRRGQGRARGWDDTAPGRPDDRCEPGTCRGPVVTDWARPQGKCMHQCRTACPLSSPRRDSEPRERAADCRTSGNAPPRRGRVATDPTAGIHVWQRRLQLRRECGRVPDAARLRDSGARPAATHPMLATTSCRHSRHRRRRTWRKARDAVQFTAGRKSREPASSSG